MSLETGAALRILHGRPTDEEAVAVLLALDLAARADHAAASPPRRPGWTSAARVEAVGGLQAGAPTDITAARRTSIGV